MATSLRERKTNFRSFIYSHSSTTPENLATIGRVYVEVIGLTEIVKKNKIKNKYETKAEEHKPAFGCCCFASVGGLMNVQLQLQNISKVNATDPAAMVEIASAHLVEDWRIIASAASATDETTDDEVSTPPSLGLNLSRVF